MVAKKDEVPWMSLRGGIYVKYLRSFLTPIVSVYGPIKFFKGRLATAGDADRTAAHDARLDAERTATHAVDADRTAAHAVDADRTVASLGT